MLDNVMQMIVQNALSRAYPQGLPSNIVLQQFSSANDTVGLPDNVNAILREGGYPYGYGEFLPPWSQWNLSGLTPNQYPGSLSVLSGNTGGTGSISLTEPEATAWLLRVSSYLSSGTSISLSGSQEITPISPAPIPMYGDPFEWFGAWYIQQDLTNWGTPPGWNDPYAMWLGPDSNFPFTTSIGQWLLGKWLYVPVDGLYYTCYLSADDTATLYIDGQEVCSGGHYSGSPAVGQIQLSQGIHKLTIDAINYGLQPPATGVLLSIQDPQGNVIENGTGADWITTGFVNQVWSYTGAVPLMNYSWYVIDEPTSTDSTLNLELDGAGAVVNNIWLFSIPPWKWDEAGRYDQSQNNTLAIKVTTVGSVNL
ncbi:hypothetical protein NZD89_06005 [Alicyclobacillus fastidiosus]|uniref:PA14 domain-containing protein n=1 Tax=Alicyclobacillus fastidiosus TaxID=392011 RepID=A0ABY6ZJ67_9BACL|nr:hypothetical protein [Alicyclobacillus fastidiosus]WAH42968.1 hypothetical protein NZD89_06005 [Alicyclobacillus fastidiosus]GMA64935.1 hypothetical protein GCM10025859_53750 [Alicyclobacillus fastidiosus]